MFLHLVSPGAKKFFLLHFNVWYFSTLHKSTVLLDSSSPVSGWILLLLYVMDYIIPLLYFAARSRMLQTSRFWWIKSKALVHHKCLRKTSYGASICQWQVCHQVLRGCSKRYWWWHRICMEDFEQNCYGRHWKNATFGNYYLIRLNFNVAIANLQKLAVWQSESKFYVSYNFSVLLPL